MAKSTKEAILSESLRLFASIGYEGTGMREIAEAVGVKPPSLYKHFSGKQAIFDGIIEHMSEKFERQVMQAQLPQGNVSASAESYAELSDQQMAQLAEVLFRYWTEDIEAALFRRMLTMEQYRSAEIGALYQSYFIDGPLDYQAALFAEMMGAGLFEEGNPRMFALAFYAPLLLLMQSADRCDGEDARSEIIAQVCEHVACFVASHGPQGVRQQETS